MGAALAARNRFAVSLALAGLLAGALAATAFFAGQLLGPLGAASHGDYLPMGDPVLVRMLVRELVAYRLYALCGLDVHDRGAVHRVKVLDVQIEAIDLK
jgi:hypothetical protein